MGRARRRRGCGKVGIPPYTIGGTVSGLWALGLCCRTMAATTCLSAQTEASRSPRQSPLKSPALPSQTEAHGVCRKRLVSPQPPRRRDSGCGDCDGRKKEKIRIKTPDFFSASITIDIPTAKNDPFHSAKYNHGFPVEKTAFRASAEPSFFF